MADSVSRRVLDYCRALRAAGWRPLVAGSAGPMADPLRRAGAWLVELPLERAGWFGRWAVRSRLQTLLRRERIGLVHLQRPAGAALARAAAEVAGLPWLATIHAVPEPVGRGAGIETLLAAPRLVAVSEYVAETLGSEHGIAPQRIRVIPPVVDPAEHDPERVRGPRVVAVAERWGVDPGQRVVVVPGPLVPEHGHLVVIAAIAELERRDLVVILVGSEEAERGYVRRLERAIREAGVGDRVRFGAPPEDEPAALQLADVVVLPAIAPLPSARVIAAAQAMGRPAIAPLPSARVIAAAQAMGRPVIVSGLGALPECVMPAATGWIVPAEDPNELAWALGRALALEEEVRERLALRARAFALETFGLERVGRLLLQLYEETTRQAERAGTPAG